MFRKSAWTAIKAAALAAALTSCCTGNSDPHTGGFIGGLRGICCGEYDKRIEERQVELSHEREETRVLQEEFEKRDREYRAKKSELASEQERMKELDAYVKRLMSDIAKLNAKSSKQSAKLITVKTRIRALQSEIDKMNSSGGYAVDPEHYRMLENKRDILAEEYKALLEYFNSLSNTAR